MANVEGQQVPQRAAPTSGGGPWRTIQGRPPSHDIPTDRNRTRRRLHQPIFCEGPGTGEAVIAAADWQHFGPAAGHRDGRQLRGLQPIGSAAAGHPGWLFGTRVFQCPSHDHRWRCVRAQRTGGSGDLWARSDARGLAAKSDGHFHWSAGWPKDGSGSGDANGAGSADRSGRSRGLACSTAANAHCDSALRTDSANGFAESVRTKFTPSAISRGDHPLGATACFDGTESKFIARGVSRGIRCVDSLAGEYANTSSSGSGSSSDIQRHNRRRLAQ